MSIVLDRNQGEIVCNYWSYDIFLYFFVYFHFFNNVFLLCSKRSIWFDFCCVVRVYLFMTIVYRTYFYIHREILISNGRIKSIFVIIWHKKTITVLWFIRLNMVMLMKNHIVVFLIQIYNLAREYTNRIVSESSSTSLVDNDNICNNMWACVYHPVSNDMPPNATRKFIGCQKKEIHTDTLTYTKNIHIDWIDEQFAIFMTRKSFVTCSITGTKIHSVWYNLRFIYFFLVFFAKN